jgi:ATP-dependent protease ClpP protease subunit
MGDRMNIHDYSIDVRSRTIYLMDEEINPATAARFIKNLDSLRGPRPITVRLATEGGDVSCGLAIYQAMAAKSAPVTVVAAGEISSIGVLILQGGDKRVVSPTTVVMYHAGTVSVGEVAPEEALRTIDSGIALGDLADNIIFPRVQDKTGMTRKQFDKRVVDSFFLVGQDVVDMGLADVCE